MKTILIDDEELALSYLEYHLNLIGHFQIAGKYTDPVQGKQAVIENEVDIVFLDIHIPEINGIELAEILLQHKPGIQIIFVTAYDAYAIKAFELNALDYILKPINKDRLRLTVERLMAPKVEHPFKSKEQGRICIFGQFTLTNALGQEAQLHWRTTKAQQLFFYFLHHRGQTISKASLMDLLWDDFDPVKASAQLYTSIYHIRKSLEPFGQMFQLENTSEGYMLTVNNLYFDVDEFDQCLQIDILNEDNLSGYEQGLQLFKGEYLQGLDYSWVEPIRQKYKLAWIYAKMKLAKWYKDQDQYEKAFKHAETICNRYPWEEEAYLLYFKMCEKLGYHALIQRQFDRLKSVLEEELNEEPNDDIMKWYRRWSKKTKE